MGSSANRNVTLTVTALLVSALASAQSLEVDHFWIHVSPNAPELQALVDAGFAPYPRDPYQHIGMGTAANFVRFRNIYLELIWVEDSDALTQTAPSFAATLLGRSDVSPFGIGLRGLSPTAELPVESAIISAEYMRPWNGVLRSLSVQEEPSSAPRVFVIPDSMRWDSRVSADPTLLEATVNDLGVETVSRIRIIGPGLPSPSSVARYLSDRGVVTFEPGSDPLLELEFDGGGDEFVDFRPSLPLVLRYSSNR